MTSFISIVVTILFLVHIFDSPIVLVAITLIYIIVNLIITAEFMMHKKDGGSPLLTAVSLFIVTIPPIVTLFLFFMFVAFLL
jgi:hypothetical protein